MTVKAGQKCTAIRRAMAPAEHLDAVEAALRERLAKTKVGDPRDKETRMGALVSLAQRDDVRGQIAKLVAAGRADRRRAIPTPIRRVAGGAFMQPILLRTDDPVGATTRSTMSRRSARSRRSCPTATSTTPSRSPTAAWAACALSLFTHSPDAARDFVRGAAAYHGRMLVIDRTNAAESTGHGSPLPVLVHGGPGRAGGSEEMGGVRGVKHYMQRTAIQSSPAMIAAITGAYHRRRAQARHRRPPVPQADERARHRRHAEDRQPHRDASRTSSISPSSPATNSTPTWTRKRPRRRRSSRAGWPTAI